MSRKPSILAMILAASLCFTNISSSLALAAEVPEESMDVMESTEPEAIADVESEEETGAEDEAEDSEGAASDEDEDTRVLINGIAPVETEGQSVTPGETDGQTSDDLFASYVNNAFGIDSADYNPGSQVMFAKKRGAKSARSSLSDVEAAIYDKIASELPAIAAGERESAEFEIAAEEMGLEKTYWTAAELGMVSIFVLDENGEYKLDENGYVIIDKDAVSAVTEKTEYNLKKIINALMSDYPYQLYWFDKLQNVITTGIGMTAWYDEEAEDYVMGIVGSITLSFPVAEEFAAGMYTVDTLIGQSVQTAVANANAIVEEHSGESDFEKLCAYREEICDLVSYNYEAAEGGVSYGNPYQMIWVFDGDPDTNVVCEGYAKAFKYLCDQTDFDGYISCIIATGTMSDSTGEDAHMWNVVKMEDGYNYLADVTNCDEGTAGEPDLLFLAGTDDGDVDNGYTFAVEENVMSYCYDSIMFMLHDEQDMVIHNKIYPGLIKDLGRLKISGISDKSYTGMAIMQNVVVKDGSKKLVKDRDYTVSYKNNVNIGTATVTIQGIGRYGGTVVREFTILVGKTARGDLYNLANNVKVTWKAVPGEKYYKVYRSGVKEPVIVTSGLVGWDNAPGLVNGREYTYTIVASLTGKGDASGDSALSYSKVMYRLKTVAIRSVKNTAPGKVTVKYDKTASGDSYVLQYCEREDMVGAKTKVVLGAANTSYVIGGLKKGKTYYISIRVRKKVEGVDYYTTFGVAKKVKITQ